MSTSVFEGTPSVTVVDSRGLIIRDINFCRTVADGNAEIRITRHQYNSRGALTQSIDPRLYEFQQQDTTVKANVTYLTSLDGTPLRTASVDAGTTIAIKDAADRPVVSINANGVVRSWLYETRTLAGRLLNISEKPAAGSAIVRERFIWADVNTSTQNWNLAGTCVRHYDPAGMNEITSIALTGSPLSISRQLLLNNSEANWPDGAESVWRALLQSEKLITQSTLDATGALLNQTDAKGNQQSQAYDVAGQLKASWMTLMGGTKQVILASLTYSAAGQKLREEHGNGVVTSYRYEPQTQRLLAIKTERPTGHQEGAKVLQDLQYSYDPVGNIVNVSNGTEATKFWLNQVIKPENSYSYDSLYQLVRATGREMANAAQQSSDLPQAGSFDNATYTNYTRTYRYDTAGNLTQISHSALASYTQSITVSDRSNRAVLSTLTDKPSEVDALFTLGGEQKQLHNGKPSTGQQSASQLSWTSRGELMKVILVKRVGDTDDSESYQYDSASQRIVKSSTQKTAGTTQIQRAVYLPGLELRSTFNGVAETKKMHIIAMGEAGRAQVRLLHWDIGLPANITNNQLRYSYDNLIGSTTLEVDSRGLMISQEEYYPYGGTAVLLANSQSEVDYKTIRYSGKERDLTGLYYYGYRYYQPWVGRWLSADPMGSADGLNLFCMVQNNPISFYDLMGLNKDDDRYWDKQSVTNYYEYLVTLKTHLRTLDRSLSAAGDDENVMRNVALLAGAGVVKSSVAIGGGAVGGLVGASIGTIALPVVGTAIGGLVGGAVGAAIGAISGKAIDYVRDKVAYKYGIVSPYPKTTQMVFDLNHYDENFFMRKTKGFLNKKGLKNLGTSLASGGAVNSVVNAAIGTAFIRLPVYELADLAYHTNKASKGLSPEKSQYITDTMDQIQGILDDNHADAINFMRTEYGDHDMLMTGVISKLKRGRLSIATLARAKNKVDMRMQSINQKIKANLQPPVRRLSFSEL